MNARAVDVTDFVCGWAVAAGWNWHRSSAERTNRITVRLREQSARTLTHSRHAGCLSVRHLEMSSRQVQSWKGWIVVPAEGRQGLGSCNGRTD
jgi:hypothetical protein